MKYHFLFLILIITAYNSTAQTKKIKQCVIEKGTLKMVDTEYDPSTGIYYVSVSGTRYRFDEAYPSGIDYAAAASWYINNEPITVNGQVLIVEKMQVTKLDTNVAGWMKSLQRFGKDLAATKACYEPGITILPSLPVAT